MMVRDVTNAVGERVRTVEAVVMRSRITAINTLLDMCLLELRPVGEHQKIAFTWKVLTSVQP